MHLVRITERRPGVAPTLSMARERVERDWRDERRQALNREARAPARRYVVRVEGRLVTRVAALLLAATTVAHAHSFDPTLLDLRERGGGIYDVLWKSPVPQGEAGPVRQLTPVFVAACRRVGPRPAPSATAEGLVVFRIDCGPDGLRGHTIGVAGLAGHPTDVVLRIQWADGTLSTSVLRSGADELVVPGTGAGAPLGTVLRRYGALGMEHILGGTDHLAFVLGLRCSCAVAAARRDRLGVHARAHVTLGSRCSGWSGSRRRRSSDDRRQHRAGGRRGAPAGRAAPTRAPPAVAGGVPVRPPPRARVRRRPGRPRLR
jgi:hypothetical protein